MRPHLLLTVRLPSLALAAILQILPITRAALPVMHSANQVLAIVFRWAAGIAAAMGGVQAVSGASTTINSAKTANGTNGVPFSFRVTTAPDQAGYWTATGLPPGLSLSGTSGKPLWRIQGTPTAEGVYRVNLTAREKQSSTGNRVTTGVLTITIRPGASPPSLTTEPQDLSVIHGQTANFAVEATGPPLAYQWRFEGQPMSGEIGATLSVTNAGLTEVGGYDVVVSNASGSVTSRVAQLTVLFPPTVTTQPTGGTVEVGTHVVLSVAADGTSPLTYQWQRDGVDLPGETGATLDLGAVTLSQGGSYRVGVSNVVGTVTSDPAVLVVQEKVTVPAPQFAVVRLDGTRIVAEFQGAAGATYAVERSTDLTRWEQTATVGPSTTGGTLIAELETPATVVGFLRLRVLP
ncbi:MAG: immunoglobulin domain-containing protein [Verrucomicrobiales bacterium]|nr:immunoglobulin domain-containing protein [Verrucomicrobiales bacterium]